MSSDLATLPILVVSGFEPSGRVGLLADISTAASLGTHAWGVPSALTAQGQRTFHLHASSALVVRRQIDALLELGSIGAVKIGMIPNASILRAVDKALRNLRVYWVVDPVVFTSQNQQLSTLKVEHYLSLARANVILTPNLNEAVWLVGRKQVTNGVSETAGIAVKLSQMGFGAVVIKGGHGRGAPTDVVCINGKVSLLPASRVRRSPKIHRGTGCRFATAMAVYLSRGKSTLSAAVGAQQAVRVFLKSPTALHKSKINFSGTASRTAQKLRFASRSRSSPL